MADGSTSIKAACGANCSPVFSVPPLSRIRQCPFVKRKIMTEFKLELEEGEGILESVVDLLAKRRLDIVIVDDEVKMEAILKHLFEVGGGLVLKRLLPEFGPIGLAHALNAAAAWQTYEMTPWNRELQVEGAASAESSGELVSEQVSSD